MPFFIVFFLFLTSCSLSSTVPFEVAGESIELSSAKIFRTKNEKINRTSRVVLSDEAKAKIAKSADSARFISIGAEIAIPYEKKSDIKDISFRVIFSDGERRAVARAKDLQENPITKIRLSLCVSTEHFPDFLEVSGGEAVRFFCVGAQIGWQKDAENPLFAFGTVGGMADFSFSGADFSSAENDFEKMPYLFLKMLPCSDHGDVSDQKRVRFSFAGEKISVRRNAVQTSAKLYTEPFSGAAGELLLSENAEMISAVFLRGGENLRENEPLLADPGLVVRWKKSSWRHDEYELFRWEQFPSVILFDTKDFAVQNRFFTRLAFFAEKKGYRGKLMSDEFVLREKGYNAHDYSAETLALFFETARKQQFLLNEHELLLKKILVENAVIVENETGEIKAGNGAVISISQESPVYLRTKLLSHEGWHGIFFTDSDFRTFCASAYNTMDKTSRAFMHSYWSLWASLNYDPADSTLMQNETMAYLLQQSVSETAPYFLHLTEFNTVKKYIPELAEYVVQTEGKGFTAAALRYRSYVYERYGLSAGRISLVSF